MLRFTYFLCNNLLYIRPGQMEHAAGGATAVKIFTNCPSLELIYGHVVYITASTARVFRSNLRSTCSFVLLFHLISPEAERSRLQLHQA